MDGQVHVVDAQTRRRRHRPRDAPGQSAPNGVPSTGDVIAIDGAVVSNVHATVALSATLPRLSVARVHRVDVCVLTRSTAGNE